MKYFKVTYVSQKTLYSEGYKTFQSWVSAESKHAAKQEALRVLAQEEPTYGTMYKAPRLEEITEEDYRENTAPSIEALIHEETLATDQYCALLTLFGEQAEYDADECRDADDLLSCPEEEPAVYAAYLSLRREVADTVLGLPRRLTLPEMQVLAVQHYHAQLCGGVELPPKRGDNHADIPVKVAECEPIQADDAMLTISPECREGPAVDEGEAVPSHPFLAAYPPVKGDIIAWVESDTGAEAVAKLNQQLVALGKGSSLVVTGLSQELYHAVDGYSSTQLRLVQRGGTTALAWYQAAPYDERRTVALSLGTAVHTAILEPERFAQAFVCAPSVNLRTNEGKQTLAAFEEQCSADGLTAMKADEYHRVCLMRDSVLAQPVMVTLLQRGVAELSVFYRTEQGILLKVRPDWFGELGGVPFLLDIKTTEQVDEFGHAVEKYGYHVQAAFYSLLMRQVFAIEAEFAFCVAGKSLECGRYPVTVSLLDEADFDEGRLQVREIITQIEVCERDGFAANMGTISRPWWARLADQRRRATQEVG